MKKIKITFVLCFAIGLTIKAQFFGQRIYPVATGQIRIVSSAEATSIHSSGFLTGMYANTNVLSKPFFVRKTDNQGLFSSANDFCMYYKMYKDVSCTTYFTNVDNCYGISVIETGIPSTPPTGSWYALAAACSGPSSGEFCVFATIDQGGYLVNQAFYDFPSGATTITKPNIVESTSAPGNYFISGSYEISGVGYLYVMEVSVTGSVLWSQTYDSGIYLRPNAMLVSPYNSGDLVLVGECFPDPSQPPFLPRANDGFFLKLNAANGAIQVFNVYGEDVLYTTCNWFGSIAPAYCPTGGSGYIIGGLSDPLSTAPTNWPSWMIKLDPNGNIIWSTLIGNGTGSAYSVMSVMERKNPNTLNYEYYGSTSSSAITVFKLDNNGNLFSVGNNEFDYSGISPSYPSYLTQINLGSSNDGIQVYTTDGANPNDDYFVKAYYDGNSGCYENLTTTVQGPGPTNIINPPINTSAGLLQGSCSSFTIITPYYGGPSSCSINNLCSATSIVGASNLRSMSTDIQHASGLSTDFIVSPNPTNSKINAAITLPRQGKLKADLYNSLGQFIKTIYQTGNSQLKHNFEFDFESLKLESGMYHLRLSADNYFVSEKVIYTK